MIFFLLIFNILFQIDYSLRNKLKFIDDTYLSIDSLTKKTSFDFLDDKNSIIKSNNLIIVDDNTEGNKLNPEQIKTRLNYRRKSCCCEFCGGISSLECKVMHINEPIPKHQFQKIEEIRQNILKSVIDTIPEKSSTLFFFIFIYNKMLFLWSI